MTAGRNVLSRRFLGARLLVIALLAAGAFLGGALDAGAAPRTGAPAKTAMPRAATGSPVVAPPAGSSEARCRKDPLAGVYHPWRLRVEKACITVSGVVARVRTEPDHDWHVNLVLPPASQHLVNGKNRQYEHGELVVEIIPMDQGRIPRPKLGEHLTVTGAYVLDTDHGWQEVHPAWIVNGRGATHYTERAAHASVETGIRGNERYFGHRHRGR